MKSFLSLHRLFLLTLLTTVGVVSAQSEPLSDKLDVQGDSMNFLQDENLVTVTGNVVLRKGKLELTADSVTYNPATEQATARGNVVFKDGERVWRGEELTYNFITEEGSFPNLTIESAPFTVMAEKTDKISPIQTRMRNVVATTCPEPVDPEFSLTSGTVDVYEESIIVLRHPVFRLHGVPFFYLPRLTLDENREPTNVDIVPGYSSRDGASLLTALNLYPSDEFRTKTHVDYRTERGVAFGQDLIWYDALENRDHTRFKAYFALDDRPYKNEDEEASLRGQGVDLDSERYRLNFFSRQNLSDQDTLFIKAAYWSDSRITRDFFKEEYRVEPVPETRVTYSALGDWWTADVEAVKQLNEDEFGSVNRLPEATFNIPRMRLGDLDLLYEGETRGGFLERSFSARDREGGNENYETLRMHTEHTLYYPTRHFGWLNVVPRAGIKATYYEETLSTEQRVQQLSTVNTNNVITTSLQTNTVQVAQSSDIRVMPELGFETSFKAFGLVHNDATTLGKGLRHVIEPFANYTFIPEPDLTSDNIYQFDSIDALGEVHSLAFGVRNKWQTKQLLANGRNRVRDLVNLNLTSAYDLRSEADPALGDLVADLELSFVDWMNVRMEARYDTDQSLVEQIDTEIQLIHPENRSTLSLNQRFREDRDHTLQLAYNLNPKGKVGLTGYSRYELEQEGFEEQHLMLRIETDCVGYGFGGKWIKGNEFADGSRDDDEYEVWFQFWLTAFPDSIIGSGRDD
jgi:lipopolysaccharide assembly outer membrane protein LptD (OstA)